MPLFCDAYLADTMHLSNEESGCYMKLLMVTWRNNGKPLPDDDVRLARTVSVSPAKWRERIRPRLVEFFDVSDGTWRQKRLEKEWKYCEELRAENSRKGKLGGRPKLLKDNDTDKAAALVGVKPNESPHTHPLGSIEDDKSSSHPIDDRKLFEREFSETFWPAYPVKEGKQPALKAFTKARRKASLQTIMDGLKRYKLRLEEPRAPSPKWAQGWLGDERWNDEIGSASLFGAGQSNGSATADDFGQGAEFSQWRARMKGREKLWLDSYGPPPGKPGCKVPPQILREFGMGAGT